MLPLEFGWRVANCCWHAVAARHFETLRPGDAGTSEIDEQQGGRSAVDEVSLPGSPGREDLTETILSLALFSSCKPSGWTFPR